MKQALVKRGRCRDTGLEAAAGRKELVMKGGLVLMLVLALGSCAGAPRRAPEPRAKGKTPSLYQRLGGLEAIKAVVAELLARIEEDERIALRFVNTDLDRLQQQLVDQICAATGGPCKYTGGEMRTVHAGMAIDGEEFDALVEDLAQALEKFHVPEGEQNELLTALGALRGEIVGQ